MAVIMTDKNSKGRSASYLTVLIWSMVLVLLGISYSLGVSFLRDESRTRDIVIISAAGVSIILNVIFASQSTTLRADASVAWIATSFVITLGIALFPGPVGVGFITILAIQWLVTVGRSSAAATMAGMTVLCCCVYLQWIPFLMPFVESAVFVFDIRLVALIFELEKNLEEMTLLGGHEVILSWEQSSLSNLSSATVLWFVIVGLVRGTVTVTDIISLLTLLFCLFILNTVKLGFLALTQYSYEFWSVGHGSVLFEGLIILISVAIPLRGATIAQRSEAR
jgi:hypothetical protein